ncbi:hypothetical protein TSUD_136510 [Trifolium subterraneum]|uniref:Uncharacterized protein n=1 Tax=Trifolium subterraneum TaxID=3900 RepID=A0A2Z6P4N9_TRISU|nr:hypothetical protein TSUD_136510 [Trifolium subterraneum]
MTRDLQNKIAVILPPHHDHGRDVIAGAVGNNADFSVAAMYNKLCGFDMDEVDLVWSKIWELSVTERRSGDQFACFKGLSFSELVLDSSGEG